MTKTTFRERLEMEYANADAKYYELSAIAETYDDDDVWAEICEEADKYWRVREACADLLNAMNNELI